MDYYNRLRYKYLYLFQVTVTALCFLVMVVMATNAEDEIVGFGKGCHALCLDEYRHCHNLFQCENRNSQQDMNQCYQYCDERFNTCEEICEIQ